MEREAEVAAGVKKLEDEESTGGGQILRRYDFNYCTVLLANANVNLAI